MSKDRNYIEQITIDNPKNTPNINIKLNPLKEGLNTITIFTGKNQTGKTHLLSNLEKIIKKDIDTKSVNISAKFHNEKEISLFSIIDMNSAKDFIKTITDKYGTSLGGNMKYGIKNFTYKFLQEELQNIYIKYINKNFDSDQWNNKEKYKSEILKELGSFFPTIYPANINNQLVKDFERLVQGQLFIGALKESTSIDSALTFYIKYSDNQIFLFSNWSDGQKVLLILLIICHYGNIDVLFLDELENNLHPEYMTFILEEFKKYIPQTIITSHNPHLIFSKKVDKVFYLDIEKEKVSENREPTEMPNLKKIELKPFKRTVTELKNDIDKMVSSYHLFDNFDKELLNMSSITYSEINKEIISSVKNIFHYDAIDENKKVETRADIQSSKLGKILLQLSDNKAIKILDYGAGVGRTYFEIKKENIPIKLDDKHLYHFWEANELNKEKLKKKLESQNVAPIQVKVIDKIDEMENSSYDVIYLANVIHECNPNDMAKIIKHCENLLNDDGVLIIIELDPLITAEKFAVSYSSTELSKIFDQIGWTKYSDEKINIMNSSINAYWLSLKKRKLSKRKSITEIKEVILQEWENIKDKYLMGYEGVEDITTVHNFNSTLNCLTIIASILSYKEGRWIGWLEDDEFYNNL
ncbi:AAA family ATPase [Aliarcobacter butzleri]|uniref:AAA family ATPase n=1 Tax=Aliarcobacter butzleri TaxID=28197 RepID=UPI00062E7EAC|nr:AAA family ATPase [Aliarcobacter butzleri]KLD98303.1 hypothetical protein AF74_03560 [Aliarcobacter butzleri L349]